MKLQCILWTLWILWLGAAFTDWIHRCGFSLRGSPYCSAGGTKPASASLQRLCLPNAARDLWAEAGLNCSSLMLPMWVQWWQFFNIWQEGSELAVRRAVSWQLGGEWAGSPRLIVQQKAHLSASQILGDFLCQSQGWRKCSIKEVVWSRRDSFWGSETEKYVWQCVTVLPWDRS